MKNCLILHGTSNDSQRNWFQWLRGNLEDVGFKVWVPDLPGADVPNPKTYNEFLFSSDWDFNDESILVGHSSGAVEIFSLLQNLSDGTQVDKAILVGAFKDNLGVDDLSRLFDETYDWELIKTKAKEFIFFHSDNDPYCPLDHAEYLAKELDGELIVMPGEAHFSISTAGEKYKEFPELLEKVLN
jgi:predicted alpha/beta hydrolase family esterase